ncbi:MAG: radical SAM protein [Lachnospiraceae bacterium]|nr:radical SAM protein [Lachnospiraceae bacterium]
MSQEKETLKNILRGRVFLKVEVDVYGVNIDFRLLKNLDLGGKHQEQVHALFEMDHVNHAEVKLPCDFSDEYGIIYPFHYDPRSSINIRYEDEQFLLYRDSKLLFPIKFGLRPKFYSLKTSDGTLMSTVAMYSYNPLDGGFVNIAYSNECSLKALGLDCLFCNANATKDTYADKEHISWKNPRQIGETVKAAIDLDDLQHVNITGGFVPERREVDYYVDVAEAIQEETGLEDFHGNAVIGAPADLSIIDKYKEAGYTYISTNLEVWDENFFKVICPGKHKECGGRENWLRSLEYEAEVFGRGHVRSSFVAGIEPKARTLEGIEYLAEKGIIGTCGIWCPNPGSKLEGHRTPTPEWHWDLHQKTYTIYKKAGFSYHDVLYTKPAPNDVMSDIFRVEEELLPVYKEVKE